LFFTNKAFITSRSEDLRVDQLSQVQLSFKAIGFRDEREPQLPIDPTPPTRTGNPTIDNVQKNPTAFNNDLLSKAADISKKFFA
jgi:hypothetical protein